jgi:transcriptional regulator with XRE-family HTH domain
MSTAAIAERLRLTREATALSQAQWCRRVGISTTAWNNYESAARRISLEQAFKVCSAMGLTLDWIYRGISAGLPMQLATAIQRLETSDPRRA